MPPVLSQSRTTANYSVDASQTIPGLVVRPLPEGFRKWLPAVVVLLGLPFVALIVAKYALMAPLKNAFAASPAEMTRSGVGDPNSQWFYTRLPIIPTDAAGYRHGFRGVALLGATDTFKATIKRNEPKLVNVAANDLKGVTVDDLQKPGALDAKRAELLADINHALGRPIVQELYIAEWPEKMIR